VSIKWAYPLSFRADFSPLGICFSVLPSPIMLPSERVLPAAETS
jgi:hypothetical protein